MQEHQIGAQLSMLNNLLKRQMACAAASLDHDLTAMQAMIVHHLIKAGPERDLFQRDIETTFRLRRSTATGILKLMEQHGLLEREPVAYDARLKRLVLTDRARALDAQIAQQLVQTETLLRAGICADDLETWFRVCGRIRANLEHYPCKSEGQE